VWRDTEEIKRSREVVSLIGDWDRTLEVPIVIVAATVSQNATPGCFFGSLMPEL
jgi:hypothetical protein